MTCADVQALAGNYLDGELPEELCHRVQRHLLRCPNCREEVESLRMAVAVLRDTHTLPTPGEVFIQSALRTLRGALEIDSREAHAPGQLVLRIGE